MSLQFLIDWNGDSDYGDTGEDVSSRVLNRIGASWSRGKDQIRQFAPAAAGQLAFALNNESRDYSPGNASSPIYGLVLPGRKAKLQTDGLGGEDLLFVDGSDFEFVDGSDLFSMGTPSRVIWRGLVEDIGQNPSNAERSVGILCLGDLSRLSGKTISTGLYQNILTSVFLGHVLDEAGWPADERTIQTGLTTMSFAWADNEDALEVVERIRATEGPGASLYEDPNGFLVFENRDARTTQTRSTVSQATFTAADDIQALNYNPNFKDTIEAAVIQVDERQVQGQTTIWELGQSLTLGPLEFIGFQIRSSSGDPFTNAILPSATPNDTIQTATASATLTAGTFKLRFRGVTTASALDWDSTAAEWQTALEGLSTIGSGNVLCSGGPISTAPIQTFFIGTFAGQSITDLIEVVDAVLNPVSAPATVEMFEIQNGDGIFSERQGIRSSSILTAGSYLITFGVAPTSTIAYNANAAAVQTAIRTVYSGATVTGTALSLSGGGFTVNFIVATNEPLGEITEITSITAQVGSASIGVEVTTQGGVADFQIQSGGATFAFSRTSGASILLSVAATGAGVTLNNLRVRGQLVPVVRSHQVSFPEDTTDIPVGKIARPNVKPEISLQNARDFVEMFVERRQFPVPSVTIVIITELTDSNNDALYAREISDRISIVEPQTGIAEDYHIEQIKQSVSGNALITEFGCEQAPPGFLSGIIWY